MVELSAFATRIPPFSAQDSVNRVADAFLQPAYSHCLSVAVTTEQGVPVGTISRYQLNDIFLKKYGRDLFGNRPVSDFMNRKCLRIPVESSLADAAAAITDTMRFPLSEDFVIIHDGCYLGMGAVLHVLGVMERQFRKKSEELERLNRELQRLSMLDGLTGIANRRRFDDSLALEWGRAQRCQIPISLLLLDVDYFKLYNDSYGHVQGDTCLRQLAQAFARSIHRPGDLAARYGGEEFAIILPETDRDGALHVAERILNIVRLLEIPHRASSLARIVTVSIGAATRIADPGCSPQAFLHDADRLLYQAKLNGRNRVAVQLQGSVIHGVDGQF